MQQPERLFDPETGEIELVLHPFYLERLHGPWLGPPPDDEATRAGLFFPLLPGAQPIKITLRPGLTPQELATVSPLEPNSSVGADSWWRWSAYVWTPFGWSNATPFFYRDRLRTVVFDLPTEKDRWQGLEMLRDFVLSQIGQPDEVRMRGCFWNRRARRHDQPELYIWHPSWGQVIVYLEVRDHTPRLDVKWPV
jgi:hypothetical protein